MKIENNLQQSRKIISKLKSKTESATTDLILILGCDYKSKVKGRVPLAKIKFDNISERNHSFDSKSNTY